MLKCLQPTLPSTLPPLKIPTSPHQHMMHHRLPQPPAIGLHLRQPGLQFIAEGHELVHFGDDAFFVLQMVLRES